MMHHVLVPLDGSQLAEEALDYARAITDPHGRITLVSAVEVDTLAAYGSEMMPLVRTAVPDYQEALNKLVPRATTYLHSIADALEAQGFNVDCVARIGDPAGVIVEVAREHNADAIVISTHGRSGLGRFLFGSVTTKVLEAAHRPVFVIPSTHPRAAEQPPATDHEDAAELAH